MKHSNVSHSAKKLQDWGNAQIRDGIKAERAKDQRFLKEARENNRRQWRETIAVSRMKELQGANAVAFVFTLASLACFLPALLLIWLWGSVDEADRAEAKWRERYSYLGRVAPRLD